MTIFDVIIKKKLIDNLMRKTIKKKQIIKNE